MTGGERRLRVEVLGPIRLVDADGRDRTPDGPLQRRLLAYLVLRRGEVVSVDAATEVLWPAGPPQDPVGALQNHVSRLRRDLPAGLIASVGAGYRVDPTAVEVDAERLEAAVGGDAPTDLDDVLARWQGPAYPELDDVDEGRTEAVRLEELRFRAREVRAERRLAAGETDGLAAELRLLASDGPLRERPVALLMEALVATGRRVEALRAYDDFRRRLGDEVGTEPSPELAARHGALLVGEGPGRWEPTSRLPAPLTSLVGRDDLVAEVTELAAEHRLVTLVGPGGVGKTRLLTEVGHRLRGWAPDRPVVLCELAAADPASVVDVVRAALGIDARPGVDPSGHLADVVGDLTFVVLLDNCEHVIDAAAALVECLLSRCPGLRVVATSRERLRLPGERLRPVPTLPADDLAAPAVQLFVDRARAVAPAFEPDEAVLACVAEIVQRLDGLPLAIELAAARLHTHEVEEVAAGLDRRFALLDGGSRASARHQSLWAAASWSYDLLDDDLRALFADISVFAGAFRAADAAAVCGADEAPIAAGLAQLVERSLVLRAPDQRYALLETLRAFGAEQLAAEGRAEAVRRRHAEHEVAWLGTVERRLLDPGPAAVVDLDRALPDLRAALGWLLENGEVDRAGHLVALLKDYGILRLRPDVMQWADRVTAADPEDRSPWAAHVWVVAAYSAWMGGEMGETGRRSERARRVAESTGRGIPPAAAVVLGSNALFEGRLEDAARWYRRGVEAADEDPVQRIFAAASELLALGYAADPATGLRAEELLAEVGDDDSPLAAYAWYCAGEADLAVDPERARARLARALDLADATRASFVSGVAGASAASLAARAGDPLAAAEHYRALLTEWRRAGMRATQWTVLRSVAGVLDRLGEHRDAAVLEGAVRATAEGHRIFGTDAAALDELGIRLRSVLGEEAYEAARATGAALDGDTAVEHALRALTTVAAR